MPPRLTKEIIQKRIQEEGYICIGYDLKTKKFEYICPKGCKGSTRMDHWNRGVRCACISNNKKLTIKYVREYLAKYGYVLLSNFYINSLSKFKYKCPKGHINKTNWNNFKTGHRCPTCNYNNNKGNNNPYIKSGAFEKYNKKDHYNWKGGVSEKGYPLFETYYSKLNKYYNVKKENIKGFDLISLECTYCGNFHVPSITSVVNRLQVINGSMIGHGEQNFYCSDNCKKACPTFNQKKYPKGFKKATSREVQPQLRKLVLKRDSYKCQICDVTIEETQLHCHHMTGVKQNPIESADVDNCITLCEKHHKQVHKLPDCDYYKLKCT